MKKIHIDHTKTFNSDLFDILSNYDIITVKLFKDKYNRSELLNKKIRVYDCLINYKNEESSDYYYVVEEDVFKLRKDQSTVGYYIHKNSVHSRKKKLKRILENEN